MKKRKQTVVLSRQHAEAMIAMSFAALYLMAERHAIIANQSNQLALKKDSQPIVVKHRKADDPGPFACLSDIFPD